MISHGRFSSSVVVRVWGLTLLSALAAGVSIHCGATTSNCRVLTGTEALHPDALVIEVDQETALQRLLSASEPLDPEPRQALISWFHEEWDGLRSEIPENAEVWWFKESKGALGRREGLVALDGCRVLRSVTLIDDN